MRHAIVSFLALSILAGIDHAASAQTIKLGTLAPQGTPWYEIIRDMPEAWKQASGGRIDDGSWTIIATNVDGRSCVVGHGQAWGEIEELQGQLS